jgi:hypothetical protein
LQSGCDLPTSVGRLLGHGFVDNAGDEGASCEA